MKQILNFLFLYCIGIFFMGISTYVLHKNFESYKQQKNIYIHLNKSDYSQKTSKFYSSIETELPNLSITAMPLKALKAMYVIANEKDSLNKAKRLFKESIKDNPYLMFSEANLSQIYYAERKYDSAYYYGRKSFNGLPKNSVHFAMMGKLHANKNQIDSIIFLYEKINKPANTSIDRIFLSSMTNFYNVLDDSLKGKVRDYIINIKKSSPINKEVQFLSDRLIVGKEEFEKALILEDEGELLLSNNKINEGILKYLEALEIRKDNYPYIQTIGLAYYNLAEFDRAIEYLSMLEDNGIPLDPLSQYVNGISYFNVGKQKTGCGYLLKSSKFGQENAKIAYEKYCLENLR